MCVIPNVSWRIGLFTSSGLKSLNRYSSGVFWFVVLNFSRRCATNPAMATMAIIT